MPVIPGNQIQRVNVMSGAAGELTLKYRTLLFQRHSVPLYLLTRNVLLKYMLTENKCSFIMAEVVQEPGKQIPSMLGGELS